MEEREEHLWFKSPNLSGSSERSSSPEFDEPDPGRRTERRAEEIRSRKLPNRDRRVEFGILYTIYIIQTYSFDSMPILE